MYVALKLRKIMKIKTNKFFKINKSVQNTLK